MSEIACQCIGWDKPVVDLVAERLLALAKERPDAFRRAIVVVPTAESGRWLRERVAEMATEGAGRFKPVLMPEIMLMGQLIPDGGKGVAREEDTLAAWLQALGEQDESSLDEFAPLIPRRPQTHVERWRVGVAHKLITLRTKLEQCEVTVDAVSESLKKRENAVPKANKAGKRAFTREHQRWAKLGTLFAKVDSLIKERGLQPVEEYRAGYAENPVWPGYHRLLVVACVPEVQPQLKRLLKNLHGRDKGEVIIWVNADAAERDNFNAYGEPLEPEWANRDIDIPNAFVYSDKACTVVDDAASCIHVVDDATALAREMLKLAGGYSSNDVVLAVGDSQYTAPIVTAFEKPRQGNGWKLNMPEGRSLLGTEVGALVEQMADLCAARADFWAGDEREGGMVELNAFTAVLCNSIVQKLLKADFRVPSGLQSHIEHLRAKLLPGSIMTLCQLMDPAYELPGDDLDIKAVARERQAYFLEYAKAVAAFADSCSDLATLPAMLRQISAGLHRLHLDTPMQKPVEKLCRIMESVASDTMVCAAGNAVTLWEVLRNKLKEMARGIQAPEARKQCVSDVIGWREAPYARGRRVILGALHDGCVPEPVEESEFLPPSLCSELRINYEDFRIARDSFLMTALLHSRPQGQVHIVIARQNPDGSAAAPSSLLLRCGNDLPERARTFFAESTGVGPLPKVLHCPLRQAAPGPETKAGGKIVPGMMEDIRQIAPEADKPYLTWRTRRNGGKPREITFSPSRLSLFLQCPLSFWLKNLFGLDAGDSYDADKADLESNEFGTVMHSVLERVVERFPGLQQLTSAFPNAETQEQQTAMVLETAVGIAREEWGKVYKPTQTHQLYTLPMQVQLQTLEEMLPDFAKRHVADLHNGWCNVAREYELQPALTLTNGETVRFYMKADRIDRNVDGRWRIIDYKTSSSEKNPVSVHFDTLDNGKSSHFSSFMNTEQYAFPEIVGKSAQGETFYKWKDVQLMLYMFGLRSMNARDINPQLQDEPLHETLPDLFYYNLQSKEKIMECHPLMENGKLVPLSKRPQTEFQDTPQELLQNAMKTVDSAIRMILDGKCLFSAESLKLANMPFSKMVDTRDRKKAPRFGAVSPHRDPRSMFNLPSLEK